MNATSVLRSASAISTTPAFYTDPSSNRTEQRRFVYPASPVKRSTSYLFEGPFGRPAFITTSYADGRPVSAAVEITGDKLHATVHTNRYGVGRCGRH